MKESDPQMERCFPEPSLVCYRRHKSIKDHLIRARVSTKRHTKRRPIGFKPCGALCVMCALSPPATKHKCHKTGKEWKITSPMDCHTENIIYKISCKKDRCKDFVYIGETQRQAIKRFYDHKSYVNRERLETPAGHHFNLPGHDVTDMAMIPIERVRPANNPLVRKTRESLWIRRYDSISFGGNKKRWDWDYLTLSFRYIFYANCNVNFFFPPPFKYQSSWLAELSAVETFTPTKQTSFKKCIVRVNTWRGPCRSKTFVLKQ